MKKEYYEKQIEKLANAIHELPKGKEKEVKNLLGLISHYNQKISEINLNENPNCYSIN